MKKSRYTFVFITISLLISLFLVGCVGITEVVEEPPNQGRQENIDSAVKWLVANNQNPDGGYGVDFESGDPASNISSTIDAILAISGGGYDLEQDDLFQDISPLDYLKDQSEGLGDFASTAGGSNGKVILALVSADQNPRDFAGNDWVAMLEGQYDATGAYNTLDAFNQSLAILALTAVDEPVPDEAITWLISQQADNGSWDDGFGTMDNSDATAMSIMALTAAGATKEDEAISKGIQFLAFSQLPSGGWEYGTGFGENANSTALAIQALAAVGEDFISKEGPWVKENRSPMDVLLSWQSSSGAFQADFGQGPFDDMFATMQSIPALTGKSYPFTE